MTNVHFILFHFILIFFAFAGSQSDGIAAAEPAVAAAASGAAPGCPGGAVAAGDDGPAAAGRTGRH